MATRVVHDEQNLPMSADAIDVVLAGSRLDLEPSAGGFALVSIDPGSIAEDGTEIVVINQRNHAVTLRHNDAAGTDGFRLYFHDGLDHTLAYRQQVWMTRIDNDADGHFWCVEVPG